MDKIIQLTVIQGVPGENRDWIHEPQLIALCQDGSVWVKQFINNVIHREGKWVKMKDTSYKPKYLEG